MINITKEKGYVVITSDDEKTFLIGEGILSVPCNTIEYTLDDESDFIQFNSIYEDGILFVGTIGNIQVNGTLVTRDNIIEQLDTVFNDSTSDGTASAGVNSINGYQGDVNIKTINGESLIGDGDITIEGGSGSSDVDLSNYYTKTELKDVIVATGTTEGQNFDYLVDIEGQNHIYVNHIKGQSIFSKQSNFDNLATLDEVGVTSINLGSTIDESYQKTGDVTLYTEFYNGSYDVVVNGTSFYGLKPIDDSIVIENAGGTANGNFRCGIKVNTDAIASGITVTETDPIFTAWKDGTTIALGSEATATGATAVAIGVGAEGSQNSAVAVGIMSKATSTRTIAIGAESQATAMQATALGYGARATSSYALALGSKCSATTLNSTVIGYSSTTNASDSVVIGNYLTVGGADETWSRTNINNVLKGDADSFAYVKSADGTYVQLHTEWTGTQSEYDALDTYYDTITYNIIEG